MSIQNQTARRESIDRLPERPKQTEPELKTFECPTDGQMLSRHHQLDETCQFECPRCRQIWEPWEVFA